MLHLYFRVLDIAGLHMPTLREHFFLKKPPVISPWKIPRFQVIAFSNSIWAQFGMKGSFTGYCIMFKEVFLYKIIWVSLDVLNSDEKTRQFEMD